LNTPSPFVSKNSTTPNICHFIWILIAVGTVFIYPKRRSNLLVAFCMTVWNCLADKVSTVFAFTPGVGESMANILNFQVGAGAPVVEEVVPTADVTGIAVVAMVVVGAAVVGAAVVGTAVVGAAVVGTAVVGTAVVGAAVVGAAIVGTEVVGIAVVGRTGNPVVATVEAEVPAIAPIKTKLEHEMPLTTILE
jgi:hypothetical protein